MSNHLSQDQLSMWIAGRSTPEEQRHGRECPECRAEITRFEESVSTFRTVMQDWSEGESVPRLPDVSAFLHQPRRSFNPSWRWAAVCMAVAMLASLPIFKLGNDVQRRTKAEEAVLLMDAVNLHLSRTFPAPMEGVMALIPNDQSTTQSGGFR